MKIFRPWTINEQEMIPIPLEDRISKDHIVFWIRDIVFEITRSDVLNWRLGINGRRPSYNPAMMCAILIFAYMRGVRSSRRIHRLLLENIAFKVLSGDQAPDFRTISEFRRIHFAFFQKVFTRIIHLAIQLKMVDLGAIIVDGTILFANASKKNSRRFNSLKKLEHEELEEIKNNAVDKVVIRILEEADEADSEDDRLYGQEGFPDPIFADSDAIPASRLERIQKAIKVVEESEKKRVKKINKRKASLVRRCNSTGKRAGKKYRRIKKMPKHIKIKGLSNAIKRLTKVVIPKQRRGNTTDPESNRMSHPQTGGFVQGHRIVRSTDANSGIILDTKVVTDTGESKSLPTVIARVKKRIGTRVITRVVVDKGFSGEPNLKALDELNVHETVIPQIKTSKRSQRVLEAKKLVIKRQYWMKKRKRIEAGFGHTKENKGLRRLLLRGIRGAEIESILDAIGFNLEKIAATFKVIPKVTINKALKFASNLGF